MTTVTAADGRFAITPGTPGNRRLRISLAGFQPSEATVVVPETASGGALEELRITLVPVPGLRRLSLARACPCRRLPLERRCRDWF